MKRIAKILFMVAALAGIGLFANPPERAQAAACNVTAANWYTYMGGNPIGLRRYSDPSVEIKIDSNCTGWKVTVELAEIHSWPDADVPLTPSSLVIGGNVAHIPLAVGEQECDNDSAPDCAVVAELTFSKEGESSFTYDVPGELIYDCYNINACNENTKWAIRPQAQVGDFSKKTLFSSDSDTFINPCKIIDARFNPYQPNYVAGTQPDEGLLVTTQGCAYQQVIVSLFRNLSGGINTFVGEPVPEYTNRQIVVPAGGKTQFRVNLKGGNEQCKKNLNPNNMSKCQHYFTVTPPQGSEFTVTSGNYTRGSLFYSMNANTDPTTKWSHVSTSKVSPLVPVSAGTDCKVLSAEFYPGLAKGETVTENGQTYLYYPRYMDDDDQPIQQITVKTEKCKDSKLYVSVVEGNSFGRVEEFTNKEFTVPENETVVIQTNVGETSCISKILNDGAVADCMYYLLVSVGSDTETPKFVGGSESYSLDDPERYDLGDDYYSRVNPGKGRLYFPCDGECDKKWGYIKGTGEDGTNKEPDPVKLEDGGSLVDTTSACYDKETKKMKEDCYELYGGLSDVLNSRLDTADKKFATLSQDSLGDFINAIIALATGIAGVLAVGMLIYHGYTYMNTDNVETETRVRARIVKTTGGLLLLLVIYTGLRTINPDLLNLTPRIDSVSFQTGGDAASIDPGVATGQVSTFKEYASTHSITCAGSGGTGAVSTIVNSMKGKITYSMDDRGKLCSNDTFCWDCSGFVSAVYSCAGLPSPGTTSSQMLTGAEAITELTSTSVNGKNLVPGDILGWTAGSLTKGKAEKYGHVVVYIGNGMAAESTSANGGTSPGGAVQIKKADAYKIDRLKFIKRVSSSGNSGGSGTYNPVVPPGGAAPIDTDM